MKKITKLSAISLLALTAMGLPLATNAKMVDADYIKELSKVVDGSEVIGYNNVYFFGKYAFVNSLTTADLVKAANTLEGATDAVLYLKDTNNTWKNAVNTSETFKASDLSFNLVKIFNVDSTVATDAAKAEDVEKENATTLVFEDDAAVVKLSGARTLPAVESLGSGKIVETATFNHDNASATVVRGDKKITVTENKPLLTGKVGVLLKTNQSFDATKITLNVAGTDIDIAPAMANAKKYGASKNELLVELDKSMNGKTIVFTDKTDSTNPVVDIYSVVYNALTTYKSYTTTKSESVTVKTEDVSVEQVKLDEDEYKVVFYGTKTSVPAKIEFTVDGDARAITTNDAPYSIIEVANAEVAAATDVKDVLSTADAELFAFNQGAVKEITTVKNEDKTEAYDYLVTVKLNKVPGALSTGKKLGLKLNIGVNKSEFDSTTGLNFVGQTQNFVQWFTLAEAAWNTNEKTGNKEMTTPTTFATNAAAGSQTVTVKYVFVDETKALELSNFSMAKADASVYTAADNSTDEEAAVRKYNTSYNKNMKLFNTEVTFAKETTGDDYQVTLQALAADADALTTAADTVLINKTDDSEKKIAMLFDLGVAPANLEVRLNATAGNAYKKVVTESVVSNFGVDGTTSNSILVYVPIANITGDGKYLYFTDKTTNESVKVKVTVKYAGVIIPAQYKTTAGEIRFLSNVKVVDTTKASYSLADASYKSFIINKGTRQFEITSDEGNFTWYCDYEEDADEAKCDNQANSNLWKYTTTLYPKSVAKVAKLETAAAEDTLVYNHNSLTVGESTNKVVNVEFNRSLASYTETLPNTKGNWYRLVLDLGVDNKEIKDVKIGNTTVLAKQVVKITDGNAETYGITKSSNSKYNQIMLWLDETETSKKNGQDVTFVQYNTHGESVANKGVATTTITFKSTVAENTSDLTVQDNIVAVSTSKIREDKISTDSNANTKAAAYSAFKFNNMGLTAVVKDKNNVSVSYDNNLQGLTAGSTAREYAGPLAGSTNSGAWYGLLVDLGVAPENVMVIDTDKDDTKFVVQTEDVALYGATGNQIIVWLNGSKNDVTIKFTNKTAANKYNTLSVKFTPVNNTAKEIKAKSVSLASADIAVGVDADLYKRNQNLVKLGEIDTTVKNKYTVKYAKTGTGLFANYNGATKIALVVDLGIEPEYLKVTDDGKVASEDENTVFGITGTQVLVWVTVADTLEDKTITLTDAYTGLVYSVVLDA